MKNIFFDITTRNLNVKLMMILFACFTISTFTLSAQQDIKVQRGTTVVSNATETLVSGTDFTAVDINKAFVRITDSQNTGAGNTGGGVKQKADDVTATISFDVNGDIVISRFGSTDDTRVSWEIIEYVGAVNGKNEFKVLRQGIHTFASTGTDETLSFSNAVDITKIVPFETGVSSPDIKNTNYASSRVTLKIETLTQMRLQRGDHGNDAVNVSYAIVEFTGANWSVQSVEHSYTNTGVQESVNLPTPVNLEHTFIHAQKRLAVDLNGLDEYGHLIWLSSGGAQVSFQIISGSDNPNGQISLAWIISNPDMIVNRKYNLRSRNTGSTIDTFTEVMPAVPRINQASLFVNSDCTGAGTYYPRPMLGATLLSEDTVQLFRSDNGQNNAYWIEVVQWPFTPSFVVEGTVYSDEAETIPVAAGKKVSLSVNGAAVQTVSTGSGGTFKFNLYTAPNPNDVLLVYLDGEPEKASLVTVTDGVTYLTGANELSLVVEKIILEHQTGTEITNTNLDVIDAIDPDDDDGITVTGGDATFATGMELWISSGKTYTPGGNITCDNLEIFGILTGETDTFTVNGSWNNNGGTFTAGTSTVVFATSTPANIAGDTTFNNFRCLTPGKTLSFYQGSTQTVSGFFTIQGDRATTNRINLISSGGSGTTWNLILTGNHDCNYVSPQGSNVSGTVYLPINPAGYFDSGDNTNWYASTMPDDVIFYDNFENSTLGSASPDRESSNWGIPGWSNAPDTTVSTQNHTTNGTQSMYSSGGTGGQGDASWNSPAWGPVDNGVAECWFYDDMNDGIGKRIWASVDSSNGQEWAAIGISTADSTTKYAFHLGSSGSPLATQVTFIDRSIGWHKATWIRDVNFITLYLDDIQIYQGANTQLDNFADFDLGAWGYDNPDGSTGMYFDDCIVYRSQHQSAYRWYANDDAQNPTSIAAENTAITREINDITRVRIQLQNDMTMDWGADAAYVGLQYRQGTAGSWVDLGTAADWEYANGLGTDGAQISNALLTNTNIREHFIESQPSPQILSATPSDYVEWDFTVMPNSNANIGVTYYFRMVITDASGAFLKSFAAYPYLAECQITSQTVWVWSGRRNNNWNDSRNWENGSVPDITSDVIIPNGARRDPRINISGAVCNSLIVQTGMTLLLDTANTDITVTKDITIEGTVTHSNDTAVLNLNGGELLLDGGTYNHTGNGVLNAANADLRIINGGAYNFDSQAVVTVKDLYIDNFGSFNDSTAAGTFNVQNFNLLPNGQFLSNQTGSVYNVAGNFVNDGSMLGSTGGVFNFNGTGKTYSGTAINNIFYQTNFTGSYTVTTTSDLKVLDDLTIGSAGSLTAGTGTLNVGGDWINSGTFDHGSGTVNLNGTALQQITAGGSGFYNLVQSNASASGVSFLDDFTVQTLTNTTPASTMTFNAGSTYTINGAGGLTLNGSSGNEIILVSSAPGTYWQINPAGGSWNIDYVTVSDSVNIAELTIFPTNSTNGGHNINWFSEDQDADHLPDYWEYTYYGGLSNPLVNDAESDTDSDDISALEEYVLDTDPTIPNINVEDILFVDDNAGYIGNGSLLLPYKYLKDALDNAENGTLISLAPGTYELDDYILAKRVVIRGAKGPFKTIIHGTAPDGISSDSGQMLNVQSKQFMLSSVTLRMFRDDKPIITYEDSPVIKVFILNNVILKENNTQTKSLIAKKGMTDPKEIFMLNCLFYNNSALSAGEFEADGNTNIFNNTIVNNMFTTALILSGKSKETYVYNNILRNGNGAEITDDTTGGGSISVENCNIQGGFTGAVNSYDLSETFANSTTGAYQLLPGSPGVDAGIQTALDWDINNNPRPRGSAYDVGAYELDPNDSDSDGLADIFENSNGYDILNPDSDNDGLTDGEEINTYNTDPLSKNSDGDAIDDGDEPAMGMDPALSDGDGDIDGVYYTDFEDTAQFPEGSVADTIWGPNGNVNSTLVIKGNCTIEDIGAAAYDGIHVGKAEGDPGEGLVESSFIGWVDRNFLDDYWISIAYKCPRAKLPTDLNEAFNLAGAFFAIDENGYLNIWNPSNEVWIKDNQVIPDDWVVITVHRDHPGKTINLYIENRQAFADVPISDPDPTAGTGKFRISFSSVGEEDSFFDAFSALPYSPF